MTHVGELVDLLARSSAIQAEGGSARLKASWLSDVLPLQKFLKQSLANCVERRTFLAILAVQFCGGKLAWIEPRVLLRG